MNWQPKTIALVISTVVCCVYVSVLFCEKSQSYQQSQKNHQGITKQSSLQVLEMTLGIKQALVKEAARKNIDSSTATSNSNSNSNSTMLDKPKIQTQLLSKTNIVLKKDVNLIPAKEHIEPTKKTKNHKAKPKAKTKNDDKHNDEKKYSRLANKQTTKNAQLNAMPSTSTKQSQQKSTSTKVISMSNAKQDEEVESVMLQYMGQVRNFISKHKRYPSAAKIRKQQGTVTISFVIDSQGRVHKAEVIKACQSRYINKSTKVLLSKLRFKAAPNAIKAQFPKTVILEVNYQFG